MKPSRLSFLVLASCLLGQSQLFAQATWIGADAANWNVPANWSGTAPVDNDTSALIFNYAGSNLTSTNGLTNLTVSSLTFASGSRDNTLNGNAITLTGTVTDATGAWQTINLAMALTTGDKSFDVQNGQLTIGGIMSGTVGLTKTGGGTLVLSQKNTYSGGTIVNAGTLRLTTGGSVGAITGTVTVNSGATLESANGDSLGYNNGTKVNTLNLSGGTLTHNSGNNLTLASAVINLTGGLLQATSSGALDLYDATGTNTSINSLASASSSTISGKIYLGAGDNDSTGTVFTVADGAAADDLIVSASMSNRGSYGANAVIQKAGAGCLVVSGTNTYTGATKVTGGTLKVGSSQALGSNSPVVMTNTAGTLLDLNSYNTSIGSLTGGGTTGGDMALGSAALTVGGDNTSPAAYAGIISGTGALVKSGAGTLNLSGKNTFGGGTSVNGGTLQLSGGGSAGVLRGTVTVNAGATLLSTSNDAFGYNTGTKVNTLNIVGGTVTHNAGGNNTLASLVVNLTGGTLQTTGSGSLDFYNNGSGNTVVNSLASGTSSTIAGKVNLRQGDNDPTGTVFTVADGPAAADLIVTAALVNGPYQGVNSAIQKSGPGVMVLSGVNTYTGATLVNAGTLALVGGSQASPISVASGATLGFTLGSPTSSSSTVTFNGATAMVAVSGTPVQATLMTASHIIGTPVLEPAIPGYVLAVEGGGTLLNLKSADANNYDTWALTHITAINPAADATPGGDPDGDGVSNLAEFALRGNPLDGSSNGIVHAFTSTNELVLTIAVRKSFPAAPAFAGNPPKLTVAGVTYTIEGGINLVDFNEAVGEVTPLTTGLPDLTSDSDYEYRSFTLDASLGLLGKGFMRAKVEN